MKILYAIQGTGNGHLSRAMDVVPCLQKSGKVDVLVSGMQGDLSLPFSTKYKAQGLGFIFGRSGGVDLWQTLIKSNVRKFIKEIKQLPVEDYDLVISDFEPVSSWACYMKNRPVIALSHQAAVLSPVSPKPDHTDMLGRLILKNYAPASAQYGFHFKTYSENIFTPVIRRQVRDQDISDEGHYTVYLPSYDDKRLIKRLSAYKEVEWQVFSKHNKKPTRVKNVSIRPINNEAFIASMARSSGVLCGAGFETPAEALYMGKKLLVIPMKNQYEQHLNAAALKDMGIPVIKSLKARHEPVISDWLEYGQPVAVNYPDVTEQITRMIVDTHQFDGPPLEWDVENLY